MVSFWDHGIKNGIIIWFVIKEGFNVSEEAFQKYRDIVFNIVRKYGIKQKAKILRELKNTINYLPGEMITEKDLRRHELEGDFDSIFDTVLDTTTPEMVSKNDIRSEPNSKIGIISGIKSDIIMQKLNELERRIEELEKNLKAPEELNYKGKRVTFSVRVPEELYNKLKELKDTTGKPLNQLILKAISLLISFNTRSTS